MSKCYERSDNNNLFVFLDYLYIYISLRKYSDRKVEAYDFFHLNPIDRIGEFNKIYRNLNMTREIICRILEDCREVENNKHSKKSNSTNAKKFGASTVNEKKTRDINERRVQLYHLLEANYNIENMNSSQLTL